MSKFPKTAENRISQAFKDRIIEIIEENDCNNEQFAKLVKVSTPVITRATVYGIVPTLQILIRIADSLQLSLDYLLGITDDNEFYPSNAKEDFYCRLEKLKLERNVTYGYISNFMTFPRSYFYTWLKDKSLPSYDFIVEIAKYFKVSIDFLVGRTDDRN